MSAGAKFLTWGSRQLLKFAKAELLPAETEAPRAYVEAAPGINPIVMMAAFHDPVNQAELNACMETLRACQMLTNASLSMLGQLAAKYGQDEALIRMMANLVYHGMALQRRLSGTANESGPVQQLSPEVN